MEHPATLEEAIETLQQLGLQEYEARCFVGLSRMDTATAKQLSELTEVPRTRVYDAVRVLEAQGLVQIHHSSPQQFRAVPVEEAIETLRDQYESRMDRLRDALETVETVDVEDESPIQEVWAISGRDAVEHRTNVLIDDAAEEIVLVIGHGSLLTDDLLASLTGIGDDVDVILGAPTESLAVELRSGVTGATTFVSGLEWLHAEDESEGDTAIGRLLMVDRSTVLVSSIMPDSKDEQAIFGEGFGNGLVVIARRLMSQGLVAPRDPVA